MLNSLHNSYSVSLADIFSPVRPNETCVKLRSLNLVKAYYGYYF